jgi:ABC-type multidrug transport system fused ATPase/permease subunit
VRLSSLAENAFNAVDRVDEFSHIVPEGRNGPGSNSRDTTGGSSGLRHRQGSGTPSTSGSPRGITTPLLDDPSDSAAQALEPQADWPAAGRIEFSDVRMRYRRGLPLVLRGLTITIPAGSKVCCLIPAVPRHLLKALPSMCSNLHSEWRVCRCMNHCICGDLPPCSL